MPFKASTILFSLQYVKSMKQSSQKHDNTDRKFQDATQQNSITDIDELHEHEKTSKEIRPKVQKQSTPRHFTTADKHRVVK